MAKTVHKEDLIYPELSYKIIGCAYEVFNEIGGGHRESAYQKALSLAFIKAGLNIKEQKYIPVKFIGVAVEKGFLDYFVEEKIVVEIKSLGYFTKGNYDQVLNYLNNSGSKLALLITFGRNEVRYKLVVNFIFCKDEY